MYLNRIFLGHNCYGVSAAAHRYFGKKLADLTIAENATLAGIPKAPSLLNPLSDPVRCLERRNLVLLKMRELNFINDEVYEKNKNQQLNASFHKKAYDLYSPQIISYVNSLLSSKEKQELSCLGVNIVTTLDSKLQRKAQLSLDDYLLKYEQNKPLEPAGELVSLENQKVLQELDSYYSDQDIIPGAVILHSPEHFTVLLKNKTQLLISAANQNLPFDKFSEKYRNIRSGSIIYYSFKIGSLINKPTLNGAIVILDKDGAIKALVGSTTYSNSAYNRAILTKRPIGSTIKSLLYTMAFDQGFSIDQPLQDSPQTITDRQGFSWKPNNYNEKYHGTITLEQAFLRSANLATISLGQSLNLKPLTKAVSYVNSQAAHHHPSLLLGSIELSPLELAALYSSFSNAGSFQAKPYIIKNQVKDKVKHFFSPQAAFMGRFLQQQLITKYDKKIAKTGGGKTGTTNNHEDLWFAGFNGTHTTVIWIGFDKPKSIGCYAAQLALPIWLEIAKSQHTNEEISVPKGIVFKRSDHHWVPFWSSLDHRS